MSRSYRAADVYVRNIRAGSIKETDKGYSFKYCDEYLSSSAPLAVSLTLPIREEEYISPTLFSFFDGLIPEGWFLDVAVRNWKLDRNDRFGLLMVSCVDCVGDVSVREVHDDL